MKTAAAAAAAAEAAALESSHGARTYHSLQAAWFEVEKSKCNMIAGRPARGFVSWYALLSRLHGKLTCAF